MAYRNKPQYGFAVGAHVEKTMGVYQQGVVVPPFYWKQSTDGTYCEPERKHKPVHVQWSDGTQGWISAVHIRQLKSEGLVSDGYFTLVVPYSETPTKWHPTERFGPFSVLNRGAFRTYAAAERWAQENLGGQPYTSRFISGREFDPNVVQCD
jgi:hypothetical protein